MAPPSAPLSAEAARRRVAPLVFVTVFLDLVGFGIILPLLPFYVNAMGGSPETIGILFGLFAFTQLVATPILGRISDRVGRRRVILISLAGNALSMYAFALATKELLLPLLFASRIVAGATAGNLAACQAAVSDVTSAEERAEGMGRLGAGIALGLILGPLAGGVFSRFGAWAPPFAAAVLATIDWLGAFALMPETRHLRTDAPSPRSKRPSTLRAISNWPVIAVLLLYFFMFLCVTNLQVALALLAQVRLGWGPREVGWLFAVYAAMSFIMQAFLIGRLTRAVGEVPMLVASAVFSAVGMLLIGESASAAGIVSGVALFGLGFGIAIPVLSSVASQSASDDMRGFVLGIAQSSGGLARTIGPYLGGVLFHRLAPEAPFLGGSLAAGLCIPLALTQHAATRKRAQPIASAAPAGVADRDAERRGDLGKPL